MNADCRIVVVSDVHYASAAEQARGDDYETRVISNVFARWFLRIYRRVVWLREPLRKNYLLDRFLNEVHGADLLIANGDFCCDSGFIGVADDAALQSVQECLGKLRGVFGANVEVVWGDHDLGKKDFFGVRGGMRLESARRLARTLQARPFWSRELDNGLVLLGVSSSLVALSALESEVLPEEWQEWKRLRSEHMREVRGAFERLRPEQRLLLFCHDPTALAFLYEEPVVRSRLDQVERTVIGHLHSAFILRTGNRLAGMPEVAWAGHTVRKLSRALHQARVWKLFKVVLCPSLAGMELFKDGGYASLTWDARSRASRFGVHPIHR